MAGNTKTVDKIDINFSVGVPMDGNNQVVGGAGAAAVLTITADPKRPIAISQIFYGYSAAPTGGSLQIEDGAGNVKWGPFPITAAGLQAPVTFEPPLLGTKNTNMVITLAAPGGAIVGTVAATVISYGQDIP